MKQSHSFILLLLFHSSTALELSVFGDFYKNIEELTKYFRDYEEVYGEDDGLPEAIEHLRSRNIEQIYSLAKYFVKVSDLSKEQYEQYLKSFSRLESTVLEYLSPTSEDEPPLESLDALPVWEEMKPLFFEEGVIKEALKTNKFSDEVFLSFYRLLKNHAMLLITASAIKEIVPDLSDKEFEHIQQKLKDQYTFFLTQFLKINEWRERQGFSFQELFTPGQLLQFEQLNDILPHPTTQNLFNFDAKTENFKSKYFYFTVKSCGISAQNRFKAFPAAQTIFQSRDDCVIYTVRYEKEIIAWHEGVTQEGMAKRFKETVMSSFNEIQDFDTYPAAERLVEILNDDPRYGFLAISATKYPSNLNHNDFSAESGGFLVSLNVFVKDRHSSCDIRESSQCYFKTEEKTIPLHVTGYFLAPMEGAPSLGLAPLRTVILGARKNIQEDEFTSNAGRKITIILSFLIFYLVDHSL